MKELIFPNYDKCIVNTMAAIFKYYGVKTDYASVKSLDQALAHSYKNVVLMVFDGLGVDALQKNLSAEAFLNQQLKDEVTSVCPSTTTAAMTAYYTGLSPHEHAWLGWSLYFKEFGRCIDAFLNTDSYTGAPVGELNAAYEMMGFEHSLDKIEKATHKKVKSTLVQAPYLTYSGNSEKIGIHSLDELCEAVKSTCQNSQENFIFTYYTDPDKTMHAKGCHSNEIKQILEEINQKVESLCATLEDTLVIVSADHGLIDMKETIALNEIREIDECLVMPPFIEKRLLSFFIKPGYHQQFKETFEAHFNNQFILLTHEEALNKKIFGYGDMHKKTSDFIGDFIAIATGDMMLDYVTLPTGRKLETKGMHAGLTPEEMRVPLIIIET